MSFRPLLLCFLLATLPALMSFRLQPAAAEREALLYDVRGAFVAARADVPPVLVTETDRLVNDAVLTTVRDHVVPRTILAIRIDSHAVMPALIGGRRAATVSVEAVAVSSGEAIAEGAFSISVFSLREGAIDLLLAERIAERVAAEFRLTRERPVTLATALFANP